MNVMIVYSILLLCTGGLAVACGIYATQGNYRPLTHQLFLLLVGTVVVWALGLAITGAAQTEQISAVGRRIAPLGWGLFAGVAMHFVLAFTGHGGFLSKRWCLPLIYLPGAVTVFAYSGLPLLGLNPDLLVQTAYGWVNSSQGHGADFWDWFYYAYAAVYVSIGTALLLGWSKRSRSESKRKQARIIAWSLFISCVLSAVTDVIPALMNILFPQVSAIFMNILILAVGYCISRYQFLQPETMSREEWILSKAELTHVYRYLGLGILVSGVLVFFAHPLFIRIPEPLPAPVVGGVVLIDGVFLLLLDRYALDEKLKEMLVSLGLALFTPLILLWFSDAGVYAAWAFVFPLMIVCMLFNRQIILVTLIASWLLTELFLWAYQPMAQMAISGLDFAIRLAVIVLVAFAAAYVNQIYTRRLKENINYTAMQTIASEISHSFVSVNAGNLKEKLYQTLKQCGVLMQCDKAYFVMLDAQGQEVFYAVEWLAEATPPLQPTSEAALGRIRPELLRRLKTSGMVVIKDSLRLPRAAGPIKDRLIAEGIRSLVAAPINKGTEIIGFLGFNASKTLSRWNLDSPVFIRLAAGIISDAVAKVDNEQALTRMALHDHLTGLPNRRLFRERLNQAIIHAGKTGRLLGVVFLDLDGFKSVNDMLGHDQGDRLLVEIARALSGVVRSQDTVARFGGDEFVLLLNALPNQGDLLDIMDRMMETIQRPMLLAGQEFFISVSAGVAVYPLDGQDGDTLLKNADITMYEAKNLGKGRYLLCTQEVKARTEEKARLTHLLCKAQENGQLFLHYQPQIDLESQRIVGLEALLRWNLPGRGVIGPGTFIPLAEQTGMIHSIGAWVLLQACTACRRLHELGCSWLRMAVNISVHQLKNPKFVQVVGDLLAESGLPPQYLELEITESVANGNADGLAVILHQLKALGVSISIDDFGTEYSSLSRLKALPIDRIKMDMQFVNGIETNTKDQAITKVIINLAKSLNLKVIAEGVETIPQLHFLSQRRCDEAQGYYYYKPMPFQEIASVLARQLQDQGPVTEAGASRQSR